MTKIADKYLESGGGLGLGSEGNNDLVETLVENTITTFKTFSAITTSSFKLEGTAIIDATTNFEETFVVEGRHTSGGEWKIMVEIIGEDIESGLAFSITGSGNLKYNIPTLAGYVSGELTYSIITKNV